MERILGSLLKFCSRGIVLISVRLSFSCTGGTGNMASSSSDAVAEHRHGSSGDDPVCSRLRDVVGDQKMSNDMMFCGDLSIGREHIVYFGGDVQDFAENMSSHRDNKRHVQWCFEKTARLLKKRFPDGNIWIIRPSTMYLKTLSVFSNFVDCNEIGTPTFSEDHGAVRHLSKLLVNAMHMVNISSPNACNSLHAESSASEEQTDVCPSTSCVDTTDNLPITLIGFSKGCVVLNQILHELHLADTDEQMASHISRIVAFYWLDGGHVGNSGTWITSDAVLHRLANLKVKLFAHVTPYQMEDQMRYWIAKEEKKFVSKLKRLGAAIVEKKHFEEEPRSIELHFRLLEAF